MSTAFEELRLDTDDMLLMPKGGGPYVAQVFIRDNGETGRLIPEYIRYGKLFEASPKLLEALRVAARYVSGEGTDEEIQLVYGAIAEATGESA